MRGRGAAATAAQKRSSTPPRGTRERQRGREYKRFVADLFAPQSQSDGRKSKNRRFLAAFFSIFLSLLKEIWPPEAEKRKQNIADAGRRGRWPLRRVRPSKYAGIQRCTDAGTIMAQGTINVVRGSGSGDRSAGDSVRNLFAPQLQLDEREIQRPSVFGGVLFHISFAVERNMAAGGIHAGRGCSPQSENGKRAVGDAGPYGGSDESAPVFKGAPMRAVGDAGPYGGSDESAPVFEGAPMRVR